MSSPVTPNSVKTMLPTTSGSNCNRMKRLINFPLALYNLVAYLFKEDGTPTDQFKSDICALGCLGGSGGGGGVNPNMPAPTGVNATDGTYSDKIRVSWNTVTPPTGIDDVTEYDIYRSLSTNADPNEATLVGTVSAPTTIFDDPVDADLAVGSTYNYWVRARNDDQTSAYSGYDVGSADAPTGTVDPITDLRATQGFSPLDGGPIGLVWTPPSGATKYDVYRNTTNDFSTATKIQSDMVPQNTADHTISTQTPDQLWDNVGEIVLMHFPPSNTTHYFFWVVAKKSSPPGESDESNPAEGWVRSFYAPFLDPSGAFRMDRSQDTKTEGADFNGTQIRVVLFGGGGGGAGGSQIYGGGGGAGGAVVVEEFTISPGDVLTFEADPAVDDTGNAAALANGVNGSDSVFKINGVEMMRAKAGGGGQFSGSGSGAGGAASAGSTGTTSPTIYESKPGLAGSGPSGGRSGYSFGNKRYPGSHYNGYSGGGYDGNGAASIGGGGSFAAPGIEVLAEGGLGRSGYAVVVSTG